MQFDILNELLTSTVSDLFSKSSTVSFESKNKVKELEGLIKQENSSRRGSQVSLNDSGMSNSSAIKTENLKHYDTVEQWMNEEAPRRLKESISTIGINESLLQQRSNRRAELEQYIDSMSTDRLASEKKKVKNELRCYDNDFKSLFDRLPNHNEKEPFRPLYVYYKKLKEFLDKKGGNEMTQAQIENEIQRIKDERKELRVKIEDYQREFETNNNRKIRYVRDIQPIDAEYKRYKDLKNDLQKYEEMLRG